MDDYKEEKQAETHTNKKNYEQEEGKKNEG